MIQDLRQSILIEAGNQIPIGLHNMHKHLLVLD